MKQYLKIQLGYSWKDGIIDGTEEQLIWINIKVRYFPSLREHPGVGTLVDGAFLTPNCDSNWATKEIHRSYVCNHITFNTIVQ